LTSEYEGRNFLTEGIGEVTLYNAVDGDTAHFTSVVSESGLNPVLSVLTHRNRPGKFSLGAKRQLISPLKNYEQRRSSS
jgi:hypothetical protein